jgi:putative acetyltransferase
MTATLMIRSVSSPEELETIRLLFREYAASLRFDLCFQNFEQELAELPGSYALPQGRLLLATVAEQPAGCVALKPLSDGACEMKRLYVRGAYRSSGLGRTLAERIIDEARNLGYKTMRLDTIPTMAAAVALYRSLGFRDISAYCFNPIAGALFMELRLQGRPQRSTRSNDNCAK